MMAASCPDTRRLEPLMYGPGYPTGCPVHPCAQASAGQLSGVLGGPGRHYCTPGGTLVPKSKVRKKVATAAASSSSNANASAAIATRAKIAAPSGPIYIGVMLGLMVLGLVWLVVYYLWGSDIGFINSLGNWNFLIGFALMIAGLIMTMRWR